VCDLRVVAAAAVVTRSGHSCCLAMKQWILRKEVYLGLMEVRHHRPLRSRYCYSHFQVIEYDPQVGLALPTLSRHQFSGHPDLSLGSKLE
jgi:hypothetical protein